MDWPFTYHSKGRPKNFRFQLWSLLAYLVLMFGSLDSSAEADSSPPVADVEDLFKDEGFLRMSRGGEAFGRRPPPPPLNLNPPHLSTQPPRHFQTPAPHPKDKVKPPSSSSSSGGISTSGGDKPLNNVNSNHVNRTNSGASNDGGQGPFPDDSSGGRTGSRGSTLLPAGKPLEKDVNAVFSKVSSGSGGGGAGTGDSGTDSDAHPLLGITPAAPGEAFDFNPILSNPAVTRILAGSSGRMPQWEPTMSDFHESSHGPEANYTADTNQNSRGYNSGPSQQQGTANGGGGEGRTVGSPAVVPAGGSGGPMTRTTTTGNDGGNGQVLHRHNPKNPIFVPSPVSSKGSGTMYNMDQMTNNIAIPKHTLPNPSNLATSRSTITEDNGDMYGEAGNGGMAEDRDGHHHYGPNSPGGTGSSNHLDESRGDGSSPYIYDEEDSGVNEDSARNYLGPNSGDAPGKKGIWKGDPNGQDHSDARLENGLKYIVCDALCGAWKHQCKLMGILFSITSVLCLVFAFAVLYSLQFQLRDFAPFSIILLFLFATSASRAFILLSESFCSPVSRPTWLPIVSTLPPALFTVAILVALRLARFPFPFIKSYSISSYAILVISLVALLPPVGLSLGALFHPPSHAILSQVAWITSHIVVALVSLAYLFKFRPFYARLSSERGIANNMSSNGAPSNCMVGLNGSSNGNFGISPGSNNLGTGNSLKKRGFVVNWGCLQARAMFGVALFVLSLSTMIIISVAMSRGECESLSTWTGWVLSLCARMLEFAIVILLLLVTVSSADVRFLSRLTRVPINKSNVGLMNADIFPTMVSSNTAVQRCIPMYSSNSRADVMMLGPTESRSSLRGKTFGERALPGERLGEYRSSVGRGLPLRLGNGPSQSLPGTPLDGFPQGLRLPEPAPASLLVTKVVFGTPAVSREVNLNHQHENPLLCTGEPGSSSKEDRETNNIYASLESVKIASMVNAGSSTGSNHSGSDRVLLSAPRDYIYSISRDLTKTIDSIYDASRPRSNNLAYTIEALCPPLAHTIEQIGSIPNLNGGHSNRSGGGGMNYHTHSFHHGNGGGGNVCGLTQGRTDLARTIDRIRYAAVPSNALTTPTSSHSGRNFVLQLGTPGAGHIPGMGNPPPYCSSESSHDVTPDSGIVSDIHSKSGRMDVPEVVYAREYRRNSVEDIRRLPLLPLPKQSRTNGSGSTAGSTPLYDRTPTSPNNPSSASSPAMHPVNTSASSFIPTPTPNNSIVGRVEHLLNQTEHILSRTESLDSNSNSAGLQRLLSHKEQLEHVERLLAQAEYAIWLEKRNCAQQVSQLSPAESPCSYVYSQGSTGNAILPSSSSIVSPNSMNASVAMNNSNNSSSSFPSHNNSANSANIKVPVQSLCKDNNSCSNGSGINGVNNNNSSANNSVNGGSVLNNTTSSGNSNNKNSNNSSVVKNHCNTSKSANNASNNGPSSTPSLSSSNNHGNAGGSVSASNHYAKKISKNLEEESVV